MYLLLVVCIRGYNNGQMRCLYLVAVEEYKRAKGKKWKRSFPNAHKILSFMVKKIVCSLVNNAKIK